LHVLDGDTYMICKSQPLLWSSPISEWNWVPTYIWVCWVI
jgi:hypothetical protein